MSRWGEGIFEADSPCDYLTIIVRQIVDKIHNCIDGETNRIMGAAFCGETFFMPSVDILLTFTKAYPDVMISLLDELPISEWRVWYLKVFDDDNSEYINNQFTRDRRKIIVETFAELEGFLE